MNIALSACEPKFRGRGAAELKRRLGVDSDAGSARFH
jgi:hypothetical protein